MRIAPQVGKRDRSGPNSLNRISAVLSPMPGMSVRSAEQAREVRLQVERLGR